MGTEAPTPIVIPVRCAPKKAPCPDCGTRGRRKRTLTRTVRTIAYQAVALLEITYGEYAACCGCCTTFRNSPEGVLPKAKYDNRVRELVLDRLLKDGMSVERALESIRREFLLDLSTGFVYDVLRDRAAELDMAAHRREVLVRFSGTLCVDELHLGRFTLLLATDPLADLPVAFALVAKNDRDHMRRFLKNLKTGGLLPRVVVTDGSNLYPAVLAELWPEADHQLCVFHVIKRHQRTDPGRRAAAEVGDGPARQGRTQEEAGTQGPEGQGRCRASRADGQGESSFRVQTPSPDRETSGKPHRGGTRRPDADAGVPAGTGDAAAVRGSGLLAV